MNNSYAHKFDNLDEMDNSFQKHNLLKHTQEENNLNRPISLNEIESITSENRKHQIQMDSLVNST